MIETSGGKQHRFRAVTTLAEVVLSLRIERIDFGEENCCARVTASTDIDSKELAPHGEVYSVEVVKWVTPTHVRLLVNTKPVDLVELDRRLVVAPGG
jgi:hypothetical protein